MSRFNFMVWLVVSHNRARPARVILTTFAILCASVAVSWVVAGYDALTSQFDDTAEQYLGRYDLVATPLGTQLGEVVSVSSDLIQSLQDDPLVREVNPIFQTRATVTLASKTDQEPGALDLLVGSRPPVNGAPPIGPMLVGTSAVDEPLEILAGRWLSENVRQREAVITDKAAERIGVSVGEEVDITTIAGRERLTIVGILQGASDEPNLDTGLAPRADQSNENDRIASPSENTPGGIDVPIGVVNSLAISAVYVRIPVAKEINGFSTHPNLLQIALKDKRDMAQFHKTWDTKLASGNTPMVALDFERVQSGLKESFAVNSKKAEALAATALASLAAVFIIFTTLSMGVSERTREFAVLRAIALTRFQVGFLVVFEALFLGVVGWVGGLLAGWGILEIAKSLDLGLFPPGARIGWATFGLTGLSVFSGLFCAAVIPAWRAMRIRPLDAISLESRLPSRSWPYTLFAIGLFLISIAPLSVFLLSIGDSSRVLLYSFISYPSLLAGMILVTPACCLAAEKFANPLLAWSLRLNPQFLRSQLSSNLWQVVGSTLALSSGLALFTSTQIWGYTMLQFYIPGQWLPDALVAFHPIGLTESESLLVSKVDGVRDEGDRNEGGRGEAVLPLAAEQAKFAWTEGTAPSGLRRDNAIIMGFDPRRAIAGDQPFLQFDFVVGDREAIAQELQGGRACVISDDFAALTGLGVGDTIPFTPPANPEGVVEYKIAGVVSIPGWQWFTKFSGLRRHFVRTSCIVFADAKQVRSDFQLNRNEFFWLKLGGDVPLSKIEESFQSIAERRSGEEFSTRGYGQVTASRPFARLTATHTVRSAIRSVASETIWGMSKLPLVILAITSLAVFNTMMASIRSRRRQFGIMRSVGITHGQIMRIILCEALLIALVACFLSLLFGLVAGWSAVGMSRYSGYFYSPMSLHVPWRQLSIGFAITIALCLLCPLWQAIDFKRIPLLDLLQFKQSNS